MSISSVTGATTAAATPAVVSTSTGSSKIDGLISGLNTTAIISALMAQAALPQTHMKNQVAIETAKLAAYQSINTKMAALQTAADALSSGSTWQLMTTSSSSSSVVASAGPGALPGSFSFDVTRLASAQSSAFANSIAGLSANVATSGVPVTITGASGSPVTINTGDGSLGALVAGINASKSGVQAAAIQTTTGNYRLQLTSATTGVASAFSTSGLTGGPLGAMTDTTSPLDAQVTVGTGASAYTISSSSNTFNQALPGVTFTVSQLTTGVTLSTAADSGGISNEVQAMVDAANAVLTEIGTDTAFDTTAVKGSVLTGDFTARNLQNKILSSIGSALGNGTSAMSIGLNVTKDGAVTFDASAFQLAYSTNPDAVESAFVASGAFAAHSGLVGTVALQKGSDATIAGAYAVNVTQASTKASTTVDMTGFQPGDTITLGSGSAAQTYTMQSGDTGQTAMSALNALSSAHGLNIYASLDTGNVVRLSSTGYGAEYTFAASATGAISVAPVTAGLDVAGTIDGRLASGIGQFLFTNAGTPGVDAISLQVTMTAADVSSLSNGDGTFQDVGTLTYSAGVSQKLATLAYAASAARTGTLSSEIDGENATLASLNTQIANWQVVLDAKQASLQTTWANLETTLSNIKAQSSALTAAIGSLTGSSGTTTSGG